jgi:hypothetical protein
MSDDLSQRLLALNDYKLLRFFKHFSQTVLDALDMDREQLVAAASIQALPVAVAAVADVTQDQAKAALEPKIAVECARTLLLQLASQPGTRDALRASLDSYGDEEMFVGVILAVGLAASMIIVAATTRLKLTFKDGKVIGSITKDAASADVIKAAVGPLADIATKVVSAAKGG